MANRVATVFERQLASGVNDIEHIESQSYNGVCVIRIFFFSPVRASRLAAGAQVVSSGNSAVRIMPPGMFPPFLLKYDVSSVPILQLGLGSKTLSESKSRISATIFSARSWRTSRALRWRPPSGGRYRQVIVDLNPDAMYAKGVSATDVSTAFNLQNLILPAGTAKFGARDYQIKLNSSPKILDEMNDLPVKVVNGAAIRVRDVAQVRDGSAVQNSIVRVDGNHGSLMTILRNGRASTIAIVNEVKKQLPLILDGLPPELEVRQLLDQSLFIRASVESVVREAIIAACLTGLMILLFLGSWRSTLIVCISIPLSILTSLIVLSMTGHTINVMTLGGLALAVGILVDDATVEIENTHRNMAMKKALVRAGLDGAQQIAAPAVGSTLCICVVFVPVLLLTGAARYLFTPLAMAVVYAMLASYLLSRTLIPNMVHFMLRPEMKLYMRGHDGHSAGGKGLIWSVHYFFNRQFEKVSGFYTSLLDTALDHRKLVLTGFLIFAFGSLGLVHFVGSDFFPTVDSGQLRLHARAPAGTRIEETEQIFARIENEIRNAIPQSDLGTVIDNIGTGNGGPNLAYGDQPTIGVSDGEIMMSLTENRSLSTAEYTVRLRKRLQQAFPDVVFFFEAANITNQILNSGLPAPIDLQIVARNGEAGYTLAEQLRDLVTKVPGAVDVHVHQVVDYPEIQLNVDRNKAGQIGLTQRDVSNSLLISLSGSGQVAPTQWLNWQTGVNYQVSVQTPQRDVDSLDALMRTPIAPPANFMGNTEDSSAGTAGQKASSTGSGPSQASMAYGNPGAGFHGRAQVLSNLATIRRGVSPQIINHYNVQPVFDGLCECRPSGHLGSVGTAVKKIMADFKPKLPRGVTLELRGQIRYHGKLLFYRLGLGLIFSIVLVYFLMALNFQSWLDPFIILMALPGALAGIVWMLFVTQTTFSVPSLMGSIMCIGVATANSILMVVFANDQRLEGMDPRAAALAAGHTRIPAHVIMTAAAMIIGHGPHARSEASVKSAEQNAPLGRAVIGGLGDGDTFTHSVCGAGCLQPAPQEGAGRFRYAAGGRGERRPQYLPAGRRECLKRC